MRESNKLRQSHKNIVAHLIAIGLLAMAVFVFMLKESIVELSNTSEKAIHLLESPEILRARFDSTEDYISGLEKQLRLAIERDRETWIEEIEVLDSLFEVLVILGVGQILMFLWPLRHEN